VKDVALLDEPLENRSALTPREKFGGAALPTRGSMSDDENLPVDADLNEEQPLDDEDIPTSLDEGWQEKLIDIEAVKEVWNKLKDSGRCADRMKYATMLDQCRVAAECWRICSRRHAMARTPADRARVISDFVKTGEVIGGVKRARWMERRRLGFMLRQIHERTMADMAHQVENGKEEPSYPSFNTVSRRWFPSQTTVAQQQALERQQAAKTLEAEYQTQPPRRNAKK
jgi:hypothetical protein